MRVLVYRYKFTAMDSHNYSVVNKLLESNGFFVEKEVLFTQLNSHPDVGSFKSITDTLEFLDVDYLAVSIPKESLTQIKSAVIVNIIQGNQRQLALAKVLDGQSIEIRSQGTSIVPLNQFLEVWGGMVIAIEPNSKKRSVFKLSNVLTGFLITLLVTLTLSQTKFQVWPFLFDLSTLLGLGLSFLVFKESVYSHSKSSLCKVIGVSDCDSVISSSLSKVIGSISLTELTFIYFGGIFLSGLMLEQSRGLYYVSLLSLLAIPYSLYLQINVLKKWCPLCIAVSFVLILQALTLSLEQAQSSFDVYELVSLLSSFGSIACIWFLLKPYLNKVKDYDEQNLKLMSFKRNYHLFLSYYSQSEKWDLNMKNTIHWGGNKYASTRIVAITNPLCTTCFDTEKVLERIIEKFPEKVNVSLQFFVPVDNVKDDRFKVSSAIINARRVLSDEDFKAKMTEWLDEKRINVWKEYLVSYESEEEASESIINNSFDWCLNHDINATPTLFINEKRFPMFYDPIDIESFIDEVINLEETLLKGSMEAEKKFEPAMPAH